MIKTKESVVMNITFVRTCARYLFFFIQGIDPIFAYRRQSAAWKREPFTFSRGT